MLKKTILSILLLLSIYFLYTRASWDSSVEYGEESVTITINEFGYAFGNIIFILHFYLLVIFFVWHFINRLISEGLGGIIKTTAASCLSGIKKVLSGKVSVKSLDGSIIMILVITILLLCGFYITYTTPYKTEIIVTTDPVREIQVRSHFFYPRKAQDNTYRYNNDDLIYLHLREPDDPGSATPTAKYQFTPALHDIQISIPARRKWKLGWQHSS